MLISIKICGTTSRSLFNSQGFVELTLLPLKEFRHIYINAKQTRIYKITLNDNLELPFQYCDPTLEIVPDAAL